MLSHIIKNIVGRSVCNRRFIISTKSTPLRTISTSRPLCSQTLRSELGRVSQPLSLSRLQSHTKPLCSFNKSKNSIEHRIFSHRNNSRFYSTDSSSSNLEKRNLVDTLTAIGSAIETVSFYVAAFVGSVVIGAGLVITIISLTRDEGVRIFSEREELPDDGVAENPSYMKELGLNNQVSFKGQSKNGEITGIIMGSCWDQVYNHMPTAEYAIEITVNNGKISWIEIGDKLDKHGFMATTYVWIGYDFGNGRYIDFSSRLPDKSIAKKDLFAYVRNKLRPVTVAIQSSLHKEKNRKWRIFGWLN